MHLNSERGRFLNLTPSEIFLQAVTNPVTIVNTVILIVYNSVGRVCL